MQKFISKFSKDEDIIQKICNLPVYRFSREEKKKLEDLLNGLKKDFKFYKEMAESEGKRKKQYIKELEDLKEWFKKI